MQQGPSYAGKARAGGQFLEVFMDRVYANLDEKAFEALVNGEIIEIEGTTNNTTVIIRMVLSDIGFDRILHHVYVASNKARWNK
jgi:hypothetical protein